MSREAAAFLASVICGAALFMLRDILSGICRAAGGGMRCRIAADIIWWASAAAGPAYCLWRANDLEIRGFVLFGGAASALLYHITVSDMISQVFYVFFAAILKIIKIIFKILLTPARILYKILIGLFHGSDRRTVRGAKKTDGCISESASVRKNDREAYYGTA